MYTLSMIAAFLSVVAAAPLDLSPASILDKLDLHAGRTTYYYQGGNAGSCGSYHGDGDFIVALSQSWGHNSYCNRKIKITNKGGGDSNNGVGRTIVATVKDTCPGCDRDHLDLSTGAFKQLTGGHLDPPGKFNIEWHFCSSNGQC